MICQPTIRPGVVTLNGAEVAPTCTCSAVVRETTVQGVAAVPGQLAMAVGSGGLVIVDSTA